MTRPRLAVLNAAEGNPHTTRNFRRELEGSLAEFDVTERQLPAGTDFDGVVITGSRTSVYWDEPWIEETKAWMDTAADRGLPALGVCWGHQLLADVLGGTVEPMGAYEVGFSEVTHTGEGQLFEDIGSPFLAFTSHRDAVTELPPDAVETARNEHSIHGFEQPPFYGVQFHPEYDMDAARALIREKDLEPDRRAALLEEVTEANYRQAREATLVFENVLELVRSDLDAPRV